MGGLAIVVIVAIALVSTLFPEDADQGTVETASDATTPSDDGATTDTGGSDDGGEGDDAGEDSEGDDAETTTTTTRPPFAGWVDPASSGEPYGTTVEGLLTFRGNPTRTYFGEGPVPRNPQVRWRYPESGGLCGQSSVGGETQTWCGSGWTGQPAIFEREGRTWVAFGAYDKAVHFLDATDASPIIDPFPTGDIIKGTVTVDPDGFPLLYTGSRDNYYRVIAFDRNPPQELWKLSAEAVSPTLWNNDWDGSGLVIDDYLFIGGENSQIHVVKLNRGYDANGFVTVNPELVWNAPGWDQELLDAVGNSVSIENSVAISGNTLYFGNGGGLVQGWDISGLKDGVAPTRVFRYWAGDDIDATIAVDDEGMLYVGMEYERGNARSEEVGQIIKLDPSKPDAPVVWRVDARDGIDTGIWGSPAIHEDIVIVPASDGPLLGLDRATGAERWRIELGWHLWSSPVVVDDVLIQGDCEGFLHAFDVSDTGVQPPELWTVELGGCIESTPAVWRGVIVVGTRAGGIWALSDPGTP